MLFQLWVICLGPVCVPIWGLLPILFTLFPSLRKYIVGERSPQWLRTCLCLKKEGSNTPKLNRKPLDKDRLQELDGMMAAQATNLIIRSPSEYDRSRSGSPTSSRVSGACACEIGRIMRGLPSWATAELASLSGASPADSSVP